MPKETGWVRVATEGATIDGRTISKQWIEDMAAQYSPDEYTALIWPEHFRSSWGPFEGKNWGEVLELKAAKQDGKTRLFAKLRANDLLLAANKEDQKLFTSIEPNPDYKGLGKCYLMGLAVTDSPASTGTTRLKFSIGETLHDCEYSGLETLDPKDFLSSAAPSEQGLFNLLKNFFSTPAAPEEAKTPTKETTMDQEQYDALMGKIDGIASAQTALEGKFAEFSKKPTDDQQTTVDDGKDKTTQESGTSITEEQFNSVISKIDAIASNQAKLTEDFNALKQEVPGQEPDPEGQGSTFRAV